MTRINLRLLKKLAVTGLIIFLGYKVMDKLGRFIEASDVENSLSETSIGDLSYTINNRHEITFKHYPLESIYNFRAGYLYNHAHGENGMQITPFKDLQQEDIADVKKVACSIAKAAQEKFSALSSGQQSDVKRTFDEVQAFYQLNCG